MTRRAEILTKLENLYSEFEEASTRVSQPDNPCGQCRECCTGAALNLHNVTRLEYEFIVERVGPDKIVAFQQFTEREAGQDLCPYFDEDIWGCGIYAHRPFSCRVFGHHRARETSLPQICVFRGQENIFEQSKYYQDVPMAGDLRELVREFWPYQEDHRSTVALEVSSAPRVQGDELDQALHLQAEGKLQEALALLVGSEIAQTPYSLYCASLILEGLGLHEDAVRALDEALQEAHHSPILHFRRACNLIASARRVEGMEALRRTQELQAEHFQAAALLGGQLLQDGRPLEALEQLQQAAQWEPGDTSVHLLLAAAKTQSRNFQASGPND